MSNDTGNVFSRFTPNALKLLIITVASTGVLSSLASRIVTEVQLAILLLGITLVISLMAVCIGGEETFIKQVFDVLTQEKLTHKLTYTTIGVVSLASFMFVQDTLLAKSTCDADYTSQYRSEQTPIVLAPIVNLNVNTNNQNQHLEVNPTQDIIATIEATPEPTTIPEGSVETTPETIAITPAPITYCIIVSDVENGLRANIRNIPNLRDSIVIAQTYDDMSFSSSGLSFEDGEGQTWYQVELGLITWNDLTYIQGWMHEDVVEQSNCVKPTPTFTVLGTPQARPTISIPEIRTTINAIQTTAPNIITDPETPVPSVSTPISTVPAQILPSVTPPPTTAIPQATPTPTSTPKEGTSQ